MKKLLSLLLLLSLLTACGGAGSPQDSGAPPEAPSGSAPVFSSEEYPDGGPWCPPPEETLDYILCRIVDGAETGELILAQLDHDLPGAYPETVGDGPPNVSHDGRGSSVLTLTRDIAVYVDGAPATAADLEDGMTVAVACCGIWRIDEDNPLTEEYIRPVSVSAFSAGTPQNPAGSCYDLCGLYLQVLNDLWNTDRGLNDDISIAGLDLSAAPGELLDSEKAAIAYCFGQAHGVQVVRGTFEELAQWGYFTPEIISTEVVEGDTPAENILWRWEDGCLFSIRTHQTEEPELYSLPVLRFDAEKWRGPLGAYCFYDCSAVWPELGTWSGYTVGSEIIA